MEEKKILEKILNEHLEKFSIYLTQVKFYKFISRGPFDMLQGNFWRKYIYEKLAKKNSLRSSWWIYWRNISWSSWRNFFGNKINLREADEEIPGRQSWNFASRNFLRFLNELFDVGWLETLMESSRQNSLRDFSSDSRGFSLRILSEVFKGIYPGILLGTF